ncbi:MAG: cohesin domain-containing protein [Dehalococcoidia bacterium]|nr:cohesin domain-containing protein [Dehalococcoidia bacterium]MDD5494268.1 cohesin domain-containing protein [Dehalococcoidia bacterium]
MKCRPLSVTGLLVLIFLFVFTIACKPASTKIPVNIKGANDVGCLHFEIIYDPVSYRAVDVARGDSFKDIMLEYDADSPGHIVVGVISSSVITGDGAIATVALQTIKGSEDRAIFIENVFAHSATDLVELPVSVSIVKGKGKSPDTPVIEFLSNSE